MESWSIPRSWCFDFFPPLYGEYNGEYKNGQREGHGVLTYVSHRYAGKYAGKYEGEFLNNLKEGHGLMSWVDDDNIFVG